MRIQRRKPGLARWVILLSSIMINLAVAAEFPVQFEQYPLAEERDMSEYEFADYSLPLSRPLETEDGFSSELVQELQGRVQRQHWWVPNGNGVNAIQVYANYRDAIIAEGFEILYECRAIECGENARGWAEPLDSLVATNIDPEHQYFIAARLLNPEMWLAVFVKGYSADLGVDYLIDLILPAELQTGKVAISVDDMSSALERSGRIALYGIQFDTGKTSLRAESAETLDMISELLEAQKELALYVVGHTDDTGDITLNQSLSESRAASVVNALVAQGVDAARLTPFGAGPYSPVSTNRDEQGRALNRRVELVERLRQ